MAAEGATNTAMADRLGIGSQLTAERWRKRFARAWADGRFGAPRPGAPRTIGDEEISASIRLTLQTMPTGAPDWSLRAGGTRKFKATTHRSHGLPLASSMAVCPVKFCQRIIVTSI